MFPRSNFHLYCFIFIGSEKFYYSHGPNCRRSGGGGILMVNFFPIRIFCRPPVVKISQFLRRW